MPTDRDREDAETLGVRKDPHGDVEHWLEANLQDEEPAGSTTAGSDARTTLTDMGQTQRNLQEAAAEQVAAASGSSDPTDGNLVQLPVGATFGMEHKPSPHEREELVRFAAAADAQMRGKGAGTDHTGAREQRERPDQDGHAADREGAPDRGQRDQDPGE